MSFSGTNRSCERRIPKLRFLPDSLWMFAALVGLGGTGAASAADEIGRDFAHTALARQTLLQDPRLAGLNVGVKVHDRVAVLWGTVPTLDLARRAEDLLRALPEFRIVRSELEIDSFETPGNVVEPPTHLPEPREPRETPKGPPVPAPVAPVAPIVAQWTPKAPAASTPVTLPRPAPTAAIPAAPRPTAPTPAALAAAVPSESLPVVGEISLRLPVPAPEPERVVRRDKTDATPHPSVNKASRLPIGFLAEADTHRRAPFLRLLRRSTSAETLTSQTVPPAAPAPPAPLVLLGSLEPCPPEASSAVSAQTTALEQAIRKVQDGEFRFRAVQIEVREGVVTLRGPAHQPATQDLARLVARLPGVERVVVR